LSDGLQQKSKGPNARRVVRLVAAWRCAKNRAHNQQKWRVEDFLPSRFVRDHR
jgi:hypothetical protein